MVRVRRPEVHSSLTWVLGIELRFPGLCGNCLFPFASLFFFFFLKKIVRNTYSVNFHHKNLELRN